MTRNRYSLLGALAALSLALSAAGCSPANDTAATPKEPEPQAQQSQIPAEEPLVQVDDRMPEEGDEVAILETNEGRIVVMFFDDKAPRHVENFKQLIRDGFYDGTRFHRVIPGFMIQGGDPNTKDQARRAEWGTGGPERSVAAEFNNVDHTRGVLSMARTQDPNSAGSQFFIMHDHYPSLNRQYSAFGRVVDGMDVVDKIVVYETEGDLAVNPATIRRATVTTWPIN
jgi:peptidyl-prolyl cis-trans isomerase B (cyclophilin B)